MWGQVVGNPGPLEGWLPWALKRVLRDSLNCCVQEVWGLRFEALSGVYLTYVLPIKNAQEGVPERRAGSDLAWGILA